MTDLADEVSDFRSESISVFHAKDKFEPQSGFEKNLPLSLRASVFCFEKLALAKHDLSIAPETRSLITGSDTA